MGDHGLHDRRDRHHPAVTESYPTCSDAARCYHHQHLGLRARLSAVQLLHLNADAGRLPRLPGGWRRRPDGAAWPSWATSWLPVSAPNIRATSWRPSASRPSVGPLIGGVFAGTDQILWISGWRWCSWSTCLWASWLCWWSSPSCTCRTPHTLNRASTGGARPWWSERCCRCC